MAQHIDIQNSILKKYKKAELYIIKTFLKGISYVRGSLKYQEIASKEFKESEQDLVFITWQTIDQVRCIFEVHFDSVHNKIIKIYFVS